MGQLITRCIALSISLITALSMQFATVGHEFSRIGAASQQRNQSPVSSTSARNTMKPLMNAKLFIGKTVALNNNDYDAHWGEKEGKPVFYEGDGRVFVNNAQGVIDVSEHQGYIDWNAVKNSDVKGVIIRISYGWDNGFDKQALRNINECKRLGIPFGVYMYSYAETPADGASEGQDIVGLLRKAGVSPEDLTYPVFYDLEAWTWTGHKHPTSPYVYQDIVASWWAQLQSAGYNNLGVYSYTRYLRTALNSAYIHARTSWVASYGSRTGFPFTTALRGWQYTSAGRVPGIRGRVDLNAFGMADGSDVVPGQNQSMVREGDKSAESTKKDENNNQTSRNEQSSTYQGSRVSTLPSVSLPNSVYYINSTLKLTSGVDVPGARKQRGVPIQLYSANNSLAQQFALHRQSDGSYVIANVNSRKVLDVRYAQRCNGAVVWQYDYNGSAAQRWFVRTDGKNGYYIQSALGEWVLDVAGANRANGTRIQLYRPNGSAAQRFIFAGVFNSKRTVTIQSAIDKKFVLDIRWGSRANGAPVQLYTSNGSNAQLYRFIQHGNGIFTVLNVNSAKALDVPGASRANGVRLHQYAINGTAAQYWVLWPYRDGTYALVSVCSGKAIDVPGARVGRGVRVQMYSPNHTAAQCWLIK